MKKIALIRSTYTPFGGVERVSVDLAQGLLQKGVQVTILTLPRQDWPMTHANLTIVPVGMLRTHRLLQAWSFNRGVNRVLKRNAFDAIISLDKVTRFTHLHAGGGTHKTFLRIKNKNSSGPARFIRRYSLFHNYILSLEKKGFENPLLRKVRCNSTMVKTDIEKEYQVPPDKLVVVHSSIRWQEMQDTFDNKKEIAQDLRKRHALDPRWKLLLFLGSGFSRKGLDIAIKGLKTMPPDYHLIVVGKGNRLPYLRLAERVGLARRIHFLGPQPNGWRYAALCDAMVLPSHYDPFGGASAEGHAMGVLVLISDTTGFADRVTHGKDGIILKTPMNEACIEKGFAELHRLINHPVRTSHQIRQQVRDLDESAILDKLLEAFLAI